MLKKVLLVAAIFISILSLVSAQDIFWSFDATSAVDSIVPSSNSGTAYIFSEGQFGFDALDLDFSVSDSSFVLLTGGRTFNEPFNVLPESAFNSSEVTNNTNGASGNFLQ